MAIKLLSAARLAVDPETLAEVESVVESPETRGATMVLRLSDGTVQELPERFESLLRSAVRALAADGAVTMGLLPEELTSTVAADTLSVSRPTLMKWVRDGDIAAYKVGSHTRFDRDVVLARKRELADRRREAFDELRELEGEIEAESAD